MSTSKIKVSSPQAIEVSSKTLDAYERSLEDWSEQEDDDLLELIFTDEKASIYFLAEKFGRDPVLVLRRILCSEIPNMAGIEIEENSEEEVEFLGLSLSGIAVPMVLRWCAATQAQDDRLLWSELQKQMHYGDFRPEMSLVREAGMWFTSVSQLESLGFLLDLDLDHVLEGVNTVLERVDAPTPPIVFQQLWGAFDKEPPMDWNLVTSRSRNSHSISELMIVAENALDSDNIQRRRKSTSAKRSVKRRARSRK